MEIGKKIMDLRKKNGLSQEELAEKVKKVPSYISNIERNNKTPSLALLRDIVKTLDTSYDYVLINDFEINKHLEIKYKEMFRDVSKFDGKTQEEFFNVVETLIKSFKNIQKGKFYYK